MNSVKPKKSHTPSLSSATSSHVISSSTSNSSTASNVHSGITATAKKDFISIKDASILTGIQPQTLRKMGDEGKIQMYRTVSGQRKFHRASLESMCYNRANSSSASSFPVCGAAAGGGVTDPSEVECMVSCGGGLEKQNFVYCRVAARSLAGELEEQKNAIFASEFFKDAGASGPAGAVDSYKYVKDISSGTGFRRKGLQQILEACINRNIGDVVVLRKNRLATVGIELLEQIITMAGGRIVAVDEHNSVSNQELLSDIVSIFQNMKLGAAAASSPTETVETIYVGSFDSKNEFVESETESD